MAATENTTNASKEVSTEESIKSIATQMTNILERLANMDKKIDNIVVNSDKRLTYVEGKIFEVEEKQDKIDNTVKELERSQNLGMEMMMGVESQVKINAEKGRANEQYQRNFNVRIFNVPESPNETMSECEEKVMKLFKEKLEVDVKISDIDILHRLGPKSKTKQNNTEKDPGVVEPAVEKNEENQMDNEENRNLSQPSESVIDSQSALAPGRAIIVSFISRRIRKMVLANRSKLKKTPGQKTAPIIITEDLTKWNHTLLNKARDSEKFDGGVWSQDGKILAKRNGRTVHIKGFNDLVQDGPPHPGYDTMSHNRRRRRGGGRGRGYPRGGFRGGSSFRFNLQRQQQLTGDPNSIGGQGRSRDDGTPQSQAGPFLDRGLGIECSNRFSPFTGLDASQEESMTT